MTDRYADSAFTRSTIIEIQKRAGNHCSKPGCACLTTGPNEEPVASTSIGVAAHIKARSPGGPRYDPNQTPEERRSIENAIWLCQTHSREIDVDPGAYPVEVLHQWRAQRELWAKAHLGVPFPGAHLEGPAWICPFCRTRVPDGDHVCLGCHADVGYGLSREDRGNWAKIGLMVGGAAGGFVMWVLPGWVNSSFGLEVADGWGLGIYSLLPVGMTAVLGTYGLICWLETRARRKPPKFYRRSIH